ncbi:MULTISPECIES: RES family NAD+ phosphorylase [unclassified Afipia]|uniref:RES family NAD+ phosphorylase n=1 Tax=Afipia sp. NBIMC_P1-C3 TaxID=1320554 RepID=UPI000463EA8B
MTLPGYGPGMLQKCHSGDGSDGIVYPSVRDEGGSCIAAFWPDVAGVPMQERHLQYEWDGRRFSRWFDYKEERWVSAS